MSYLTFMPFCMWINMYQEVNLVGSTWILGCLTVGQYVTKLEMCQVQNIIEADGTSITSSWIIFCGTYSSFVACFLEIRLWAFVVLYTEMPFYIYLPSKWLKICSTGSKWKFVKALERIVKKEQVMRRSTLSNWYLILSHVSCFLVHHTKGVLVKHHKIVIWWNILVLI